ncbi:hypothetical protein LXT21_24940 [Myxococcus sp. K38C18041901]|uniref:hypothetical protein n=1 Tax=Myxococcus guangdongensis TaxID=2906760 RepID=UPI0020A6E7EA|nr:hypothetical protein [Myxococcus guangdongensis]MCP3062036.1 hypothetical protein [Myxococcus guangdongensis]
MLSAGVALWLGAGCGGPEPQEGNVLATDEAALTVGTLGCYVDTDAQDVPTPNRCNGYYDGWTYLVYEMIGAGPGYTYQWSDSRCATTGPVCAIQARATTRLTVSVTIRNAAGTVVSTQSAQAVLWPVNPP